MSNSSTVIRRLNPERSRKKNKLLKTLIVLGLNFTLVFFTAWYLKEHQKSNKPSQATAYSITPLNQRVSQVPKDSKTPYTSQIQADKDSLFKE